MKKNITITGAISGDLFNELVSFKVEITPIVSVTELWKIKAQSKLKGAAHNFKNWKNGFFTLDGFDNYNFRY